MRRVWVSLLVGCLLAVAGVVVATPASACSCMVRTAQQFFDGADVVFTGTLVSREVSHPPGPIASSDDPALHVFAVETVFKGTAEERQGVVSADFSSSCGLELSGDGPFVVFATRSADVADDQYAADLCGGSGPVDETLAAELTALAGPSTDPAPPSDPVPEAAPTPRQPAASPPPWPAIAATAALVLLVGGLLLRRRAVRAR